jgi:pimeloyl-ACP methyl ester carboxylesterase
VIVGSGEHRVLALHGWFGSARGWGALPDYLDTSARTWAFMDLRGYGSRRGEAGQFTMEQAAADALALADELGWDRFSLVGHSMKHVLLQAPGRVRRLVGLNPVPAHGVPFDAGGWALFSGAAASRDNRFAIISLTTGSRLPAAFVDHIVQHSLDHSETAAFGAYLESWAKDDFSPRVAASQAAGSPVPVKVIVGEHDPALSAAVMEQTWLQLYPQAELEVIPNAGHYPMFETPAALAASVEEFLGRD